jgi:thiamine-phosphate pyrophosphorylase
MDAGSHPAIADARLYFVCDAQRSDDELAALLDSALAGGVDLVQLRDKEAGDERLLSAARVFRAAADRHRVPFLINDRPDLLGPCRADGVHVGQDDIAVGEARAIAGGGSIVGLSTHSPAQLAAAHDAEEPDRPDYLSVGPVHETPTKAGRPAAGLEYVHHAAAEATIPWFAIGGIDPGNVAELRDAGATRIVVVRAIAGADDPEAAARTLRAGITEPREAAVR